MSVSSVHEFEHIRIIRESLYFLLVGGRGSLSGDVIYKNNIRKSSVASTGALTCICS